MGRSPQASSPPRPVAPVFLEEPFGPADILRLAESAAMPLAEKAFLGALPLLLGRYFLESLCAVSLAQSRASASTDSTFYQRVCGAGRDLQSLLGVDVLQQPNDNLPFPDGCWRLGRCVRLVREEEQPALMARLNQAPEVLAALIRLAEAGLQCNSGRPATSGRRPNSFRADLFRRLARFHYEMFGRLPEIERNRGDRDGRGVFWAQTVLSLAAKKVPPVLRADYGPDDLIEPHRRAIVQAADLTLATVADWLAKGRSFARRNMPRGNESVYW
jgi:hypothetical protein